MNDAIYLDDESSQLSNSTMQFTSTSQFLSIRTYPATRYDECALKHAIATWPDARVELIRTTELNYIVELHR